MRAARLLLAAAFACLAAACTDPESTLPEGSDVSAQVTSGSVRVLLRWTGTEQYFELRAPATDGWIIGTVTANGLHVDDLELNLADTGPLRDLKVRLGTQLDVGRPGAPKGWGAADLILDWSYQTDVELVPLATRRVPADDIFAGILRDNRLEMNANVRSITDAAAEDIELVQLEFTASGTMD